MSSLRFTLAALLLILGSACSSRGKDAPQPVPTPLVLEVIERDGELHIHINRSAQAASPEALDRAIAQHAEIVAPDLGLRGRDDYRGFSSNPVVFRAHAAAPITHFLEVYLLMAAEYKMEDLTVELALGGEDVVRLNLDPISGEKSRTRRSEEWITLYIEQEGQSVGYLATQSGAPPVGPASVSGSFKGVSEKQSSRTNYETLRARLANALVTAENNIGEAVDTVSFTARPGAPLPSWWALFVAMDAVQEANAAFGRAGCSGTMLTFHRLAERD